MRYDQIYGLTVDYHDLCVPWYGGFVHCTVWFGYVHGRRGFSIEPHSQHEDEGETIIRRTFLLHPLKPLVMVNSRRTFERFFCGALSTYRAVLEKLQSTMGSVGAKASNG